MLNLIKSAALLGTFLSISTHSFAQELTDSPKCNYDGNQQEMNACAVDGYNTADSALNKEYKALMSRLPISKQVTLRSEQRIWLKQRDPKCKVVAKVSEGGSIWPLDFYGCLKFETEERTKALKAWQTK